MKKNLFNVFLVCVFCVAAIPDMFAQQIKVTGKVTDSTNEGMPGVNVQVKGKVQPREPLQILMAIILLMFLTPNLH